MEKVHKLKKTLETEVQRNSCAEVPTPKKIQEVLGRDPPQTACGTCMYSLFLNEKPGLTHGFHNLWLHFCDLGNVKVSSWPRSQPFTNKAIFTGTAVFALFCCIPSPSL